MGRTGAVAASVTLAVMVAGCSTTPPDYRSLWSTPSAAPPTTGAAQDAAGDASAPEPIAAYLEQVGVRGQPVAPDRVTDLTVTMTSPPGWHPYQNPNFAPGTRMIAKGDTYPTAMLLVFSLEGDFDVAKALTHANVDAQVSENFRQLNASTKPFRGFPSSMIEGSYDLNGARMHSYNRIVIATGAPPKNQRYLIQFTVTGFADQAVQESTDIEAAIKGFDVTVPAPGPR